MKAPKEKKRSFLPSRRNLPEWIFGSAFMLLLLFSLSRLVSFDYTIPKEIVEEEIVIPEPKMLYGLPVDSFHVEENLIRQNENLSDILIQRGVSATTVDEIVKRCSYVFDLRKMKVGNDYALFYSRDSLRAPEYFVYKENAINYYTYRLRPDSIGVIAAKNEVVSKRIKATGIITSSLWNAMKESNLDPILAVHLSEIFAWSIDFFAIQKGDRFTVIYDQDFVNDEQIGIGRIHAALFTSGNQDYYAIYFEQEDGQNYFDEQGRSTRKEFLKAPLKFSRISSRFSNSRMHPVLRIRRPHHGVDYAAPTGTPIYTIGDGVIIQKTYQAGGGGNYLRIKHNSVYTTTYMHLSKFAPGLSTGSRVKQGQIIGYVGSTGLSSGPHLDFRVHMNNTPIDPLTMKSPPANPVTKQNMPKFIAVRDSMMKEIKAAH